MKKLLFCLLCALFAWPGALAAKDPTDRTTNVDSADAEMNAAIAKARSLLPHFWQTFAAPKRGETDFCLKLRVTDTHGTEHFWLTDLARKDGKIFGTINNDPETVKSIKLGQRVEVPEADISDWLYFREGKMVGNYTVRVLFKSMTPGEVAEIQGKLADP